MGGGRREAGRGRPGRGSARRGGFSRGTNRRAAHQLTAFAYTRCTPAAGSTKRGAPRAPAASRGARRGPVRPRLQRLPGWGEGPAASAPAAASLGAWVPSSGPDRSLPRPLHLNSLALLSNFACLYPGPQKPDLAQHRAAAVARVAASSPVLVLCRGPLRSQCLLRAEREAPLSLSPASSPPAAAAVAAAGSRSACTPTPH